MSISISCDMNITGICKICQNLSPTEVDDLFQDSRRIIRDIEPTVLQLSAREGCVFCQVIIEAIELVLGKNLIDDSLNPDRISDTESSDPLVSDIDIIARLHHPVQLRLWPAPTIRIALSGTLSSKEILPHLGVFREIDAEPDNPLAQKLSREWIRDCLDNHTLCNSGVPYIKQDELPTRLLDTMPGDGGAELRLVNTDAMTNTKYAALSHCWGTKAHLKTTSENLDAMLSGISLQALPKTCQDAVRVCRDLGLRYLWIDTFCIIQENESEWRYEAGRMSIVYGNAFLVLAASASYGDEGGMFPKRISHYLHTVSFEWKGHDIKLQMQPWRHHYEHRFAGDGPLSERGWAYQERLLGRRVLLYHADEIAWECNETWRCECGVGDRVGGSKHRYNLHEMIGSNQQSTQTLYEKWRMGIVSVYATRDLSKETDKLPAVSGIAEVFRLQLKDDYLAGLWRHDLISGLLWFNARNLDVCSLPSEYCAPSWSWASLAGSSAAYYSWEDEEFCAEILDAHCETVGKEPTGEVKDGWITLFGPLADGWLMMPLEVIEKSRNASIPLSLDKKQGKPGSFETCKVDCSVGAWLHQTNEDGVIEQIGVRLRKPPWEITLGGAWQGTYPLDDCNVRVWCLKIGQGVRTSSGEFKYLVLVLGRSQKQEGSFERLGMGMMGSQEFITSFDEKAIYTTVTII